MLRKKLLGLIAASTIATTSGAAAFEAMVTTNLHLRAGPGVNHLPIVVIPQRQRVSVYACTQNNHWCQVAYGDHIGWASRSYLAQFVDGHMVPPAIVVQQPQAVVSLQPVMVAPFQTPYQGVAIASPIGHPVPVQILQNSHSHSFPGRRVEYRQVVTTYAAPMYAPIPAPMIGTVGVTYVPLH
jgi:uncharacterized protein YraI